MGFRHWDGFGRYVNFSKLKGVKPQIETYSLDKAPDAYERMMSGKALFRVVITTAA